MMRYFRRLWKFDMGREPGHMCITTLIVPVKTKVYPFEYRGFQMFACRNRENPSRWDVIEQTTGLGVTLGKHRTKKAAIKAAKDLIDQHLTIMQEILQGMSTP